VNIEHLFYRMCSCKDPSDANCGESKEWTGLKDDDQWQDGYLKGAKLRELNFWLGRL
jgi:hypothetical protein